MATIYTPSQLLGGEAELIRERAFTRWMSRDLTQAATDFCKNLGLSSIYSETSVEGSTRHLFWHPPAGSYREVRSGRALKQFVELDFANQERGFPLLSLHVNAQGLHSGVWISPAHYEAATAHLALYGIMPAQRQPTAS